MVIYEKTKPYLKRVPQVADTYEGIQRYDVDNLYPQRADEIQRRSYTLKSVIERVADFLNGEGFQDQAIAKLIVNQEGRKGMTLNKVLQKVTLNCYAPYKSICLHIGYNLNYRISSITPVLPAYLRFGTKDKEGRVNDIKYSTNWERDGRKDGDYNHRIVPYDIYNPDPVVVKEQIKKAGGIEEYKGQMFYYTPEYCQYPLATFDPVIDHAQAQAELGMGKISNVQNSFLSTLAIVFPGEFESEAEKLAFQELIKNKAGARNMGSRIGLQDRTGLKKAGDIFQSLTPQNLDRLFEYTEKSIIDAIMENEAMPKELLGVRPESGMFNQDNMEQAYTYFNAITRNRRSDISEQIAGILENWETPIMTEAKIIPQSYTQTPKPQPAPQNG
jgi:hypothetical protein